jgi:hypothetical protein
MASNFLIGIPRIPRDAVVSCSRSSDSSYPFTNLFSGNKTDLFFTASAATGDTTFTFDLGSGNTALTNYIYIGRANLLQQDYVDTITIKAGATSNYASATTIKTISSFITASLYGPNGDDYIEKMANTASYRYWFVNYNSTSASKFIHSKLFFGEFLDIGRDPNAPATITRLKQGGANYRSSFTFQFSWEGIRYQDAVSIYLELYRTRRYTPIVIFTDTWHDLLMGSRVVFCRLTDMQLPPRVTDYCDVSATFEEMP